MVNDCQGRGETFVVMQAVNSTAAAPHWRDWQGEIDLRSSKQGCRTRLPSSVGAWIKFMSETTDVIDSAAKAPEGNRWEIESQSLNNNNKICFVNYLIVHVVAHSPTHPPDIPLKYNSHPESTPDDGGHLSINLTQDKALTWPPNSSPTSSNIHGPVTSQS